MTITLIVRVLVIIIIIVVTKTTFQMHVIRWTRILMLNFHVHVVTWFHKHALEISSTCYELYTHVT